MPVNLGAPLAWKTANTDESAMLADLQANILKGHGRDHTANLFLRFDTTKIPAVKTFLHRLGHDVTSARTQLEDTEKFKLSAVPGPMTVCFYLTFKGYTALGVPLPKTPSDPKWHAGMAASQLALTDPASATWDLFAPGAVHALLLLADTTADKVSNEVARLAGQGTAVDPGILAHHGISIVGDIRGIARRNSKGDGIENFGYVDGRSQPLLLVEDIDEEPGTGASWNPAFPLSQVLIPDPGNPAPNAFGSYFVFRKLEQNTKLFGVMEDKLSTLLGLKTPTGGSAPERGGALAVGRFEDGTPVVLTGADGVGPHSNDFNYASDPPPGIHCPVRGHIRKTNPRDGSERPRIMARRGITYGDRKIDPDTKQFLDADTLTGGVGLLFAAFMHDIASMFEFTQATWANNVNFPIGNAGLDPVIGQGTNPAAAIGWKDGWGTGATTNFDFKGAVTLKGGDYFYAPPRSFLSTV
jgi:deferrochelatase/peroxidase EfeB